jgi:hypothetical protein
VKEMPYTSTRCIRNMPGKKYEKGLQTIRCQQEIVQMSITNTQQVRHNTITS